MAGREYVDGLEGLWGLGVNYYGFDKVTGDDIDPELAVLKCLKHYWGANDVFFLMVGVLQHRIGGLIHIDRLCKMAASGMLSENEKVLLMAVASKLIEDGYSGFKLVRNKLYKKGMTFSKLPEFHGKASMVKAHGAEESLLEFGVSVRKFVLYEDHPEMMTKKLASMGQIFERNPWLRLRALVGANKRADILYLMSSGRAKTAYEASKLAGCSTAAAYRFNKYLKDFKRISKILNVS